MSRVRAADTVVVGHRALDACLQADRLHLPFPVPHGARLLSEGALSRRLARDPAAPSPRPGPYTADEVGRLSGLPAETCQALTLFDVIGGEDAFAYPDLAVARQAATLLRQGIALPAIIRAAWALAARGVPLAQVRLVEAPWGEMMHQVGGRIARLDGQFALVLDEDRRGPVSSLAEAVGRELDGDLEGAERLYRRAAQDDRQDPVPAFNLGNVLMAQGRDAEAMIAFQQALARDPAFAEAAFNCAGLLEKTGQTARAIALYRDTVATHPGYAQAVYNLARLLTVVPDHAGALTLWERFIALAPGDPDVKHARRAALLCRMALR